MDDEFSFLRIAGLVLPGEDGLNFFGEKFSEDMFKAFEVDEDWNSIAGSAAQAAVWFKLAEANLREAQKLGIKDSEFSRYVGFYEKQFWKWLFVAKNAVKKRDGRD